MTTAAAVPTSEQNEETRWGLDVPQVRKALKFIRASRAITADQLVKWDATHGRRLFTWTDPKAAELYRLHEARLFLNRFRAHFEGMRVRAFIHIREDEERGIEEDAYFTVEAISADLGMREQVVEDITRRMASLAGELRMWKLVAEEREKLFAKLREAME